MSVDGNIYILQYGSYISRNVMEENVKKLDKYLVIEEDDKYYVYLGIFTKKENALKMQEIYKNINIYTYLKNDYIGDERIIERIENVEKSSDDLEKITKKIMDELKEYRW